MAQAETYFLDLTLEDLTSRNPTMQRCLALALEAARSDLPILLLGESGTGKTILAQAIHNSSQQQNSNFVSFNASAMSDTLLESQLFGHEKGAFTGATSRMLGKFETADGGTLFFDEIADMSTLAQAKVLRAVEYGEFERLGSEITHRANVRIISATNRSLRRLVLEERFREDLYHRLNGITILIPPLRKRTEDLPGLIALEFRNCARQYGKQITGIDPIAFDLMMQYPWPGNLRELHRVAQATVLFAADSVIQPDDLAFEEDRFDEELDEGAFGAVVGGASRERGMRGSRASSDVGNSPNALTADDDLSLEAAVRRHVAHVYELCSRNKSKTARTLGITRATLDRKLKGE